MVIVQLGCAQRSHIRETDLQQKDTKVELFHHHRQKGSPVAHSQYYVSTYVYS